MQIAKNRKRLRAGRLGVSKLSRSRDPRTNQQELNKRKAIAAEVKLYLEDNGISRLQFENMGRRSESTINHFFAGDYSKPLLARIEHVLDQKFSQSSAIAPVEGGGYTREGTLKLIGSFLTLRNDFKISSRICAYVTLIEWSKIEQANTFDGQLIESPRSMGTDLFFVKKGELIRNIRIEGKFGFQADSTCIWFLHTVMDAYAQQSFRGPTTTR